MLPDSTVLLEQAPANGVVSCSQSSLLWSLYKHFGQFNLHLVPLQCVSCSDGVNECRFKFHGPAAVMLPTALGI